MDPIVQSVVSRIVEIVHPRQVILFGSRARGDARPDSDIDLLIVHDGPGAPRDVQLELRRRLPSPGLPLDLVVMSSHELATHRHVANSLAREAGETGVVCYG